VLNVGIQSTQYGGTKNFDAYDHYLRGVALRATRPPERPVEELEKAVQLDPGYARGWAELTTAWGGVARVAPTPEAFTAALASMQSASQHAEELAPDLWMGHTARGWCLVAVNDWMGAEAAFKRAERLSDLPDPDLHRTLGNFAHQLGRFKELKQRTDIASALEPLSAQNKAGIVSRDLVLGDFDAAHQAYDQGRAILAEDALREHHATWLALAEGNTKWAKELILGNKPFLTPQYAEWANSLDDRKRLRRLLAVLETDPAAAGRGAYTVAALLSGYIDEPEMAVRFLRRAFLGPGWAGHYQIWFPQLHEARQTEAFKQFVRELGFERVWRTSGNWGDFCKPVGADDFECT